ncbi:MAG: hypothetical protein RMJ44_08990 [Cytophagales bacterium]|nr:hypothetical protein [Bernardetiaceae bacterium]MDW8211209.1 hypothetical protein [Cytophagales bacterium]
MHYYSLLSSIGSATLNAVTIAAAGNGTINVSQLPLQNNQASVTLTYEENTVASSVALRLGFTNNQNLEVCRAISNFGLSPCAPPTCNQVLSFNQTMVSILKQALKSSQDEALSFFTGMQTGPGNDKVKSITYETSNVKRIIQCPGQPDKVMDWILIPFTDVHFQKTPDTYQILNMNTAKLMYPNGFNFSASGMVDKVWQAMFYLPPLYQANCKEEYTFDLRVMVEFENGCVRQHNFTNLKVTRQ